MASVELIQPPTLRGMHVEDAHRVQFYKDEPFLVRSVAEHLAASLRDGGGAIVLATKAHRGQILQELARLEISAEKLAKRFVARDASEVLAKFMRNDLPDPACFKTAVRELLQAAQGQSDSAAAPIAAARVGSRITPASA